MTSDIKYWKVVAVLYSVCVLLLIAVWYYADWIDGIKPVVTYSKVEE